MPRLYRGDSSLFLAVVHIRIVLDRIDRSGRTLGGRLSSVWIRSQIFTGTCASKWRNERHQDACDKQNSFSHLYQMPWPESPT